MAEPVSPTEEPERPDWQKLGATTEHFVGRTKMHVARGDGFTLVSHPRFEGNELTGEWEVLVRAVEAGWRVERQRCALSEHEAWTICCALILLDAGLLSEGSKPEEAP